MTLPTVQVEIKFLHMNIHFIFDLASPEFFDDMEIIARDFDYNVFMYAVVYRNMNQWKLEAQLVDVRNRTEVLKLEYHTW
jgi:hypothetical protein